MRSVLVETTGDVEYILRVLPASDKHWRDAVKLNEKDIGAYYSTHTVDCIFKRNGVWNVLNIPGSDLIKLSDMIERLRKPGACPIADYVEYNEDY